MSSLQEKTEKLIKYGNEKFGLNETTLRGILDNATAGGSGELTATTGSEMAELLTQENIGRVVKFTGTSTTYETNTYYLIGEMGFYKMSAEVEPEPSEGLVFYLSTDGTYYSVGDYKSSEVATGCDENFLGGALVIPKTYNGLPVIAITSSAFSNISTITSIYLPDEITHIEDFAFGAGLTPSKNILNISVGDNITSIGRSIVVYDNPLITNNMRNRLVYLESRSGKMKYLIAADSYDSNGDDFEIEDGTTLIASCIFKSLINGTGRAGIKIPSSVKKIMPAAFTNPTGGISINGFAEKITFEHGIDDELSLPTAGKDSDGVITGMFYCKNAKTMTIYHRNNPAVLNYNWAADNITPTFVELTEET